MAETDERARLVVAIAGLRFLLGEPEVAVKRGDVVALLKKDAADPALSKAFNSRSWQKAYVERLVELEILEKFREGASDLYRAKNLDALILIVKDWQDGHGAMISRLVYPEGRDIDQLAKSLVQAARSTVELEWKDKDGNPVPKETLEDLRPHLPPAMQLHILRDSADSVESLLDDNPDATDAEVDAANFIAIFRRLLKRSEETLEATRAHGDTIAALRNDVDGLRGAAKRQQQAVEQMIATSQGVLRALKEGAPDNDALADEIVRALDLRDIARRQGMETILTHAGDSLRDIGQRLDAIDGRLDAAEGDVLARAVRNAEAALEVLTDAAAAASATKGGGA